MVFAEKSNEIGFSTHFFELPTSEIAIEKQRNRDCSQKNSAGNAIYLARLRVIREVRGVMTSQAKRNAIKRRLKAKGWTQAEAAKTTEVTFEHLNRVLNGHRHSASLLAKIEALPALEVAEA